MMNHCHSSLDFYFAAATLTKFSSVTFTNWPSRRACWPGTILQIYRLDSGNNLDIRAVFKADLNQRPFYPYHH